MNRKQRLDGLLQSFVENGPAGCALSVTKDGEKWYEGYMGLADIEKDVPIAEDTIYRIYSMSKIVTCTAALMLYEQGKFLLNDPLEAYLPEFKHQRVYQSGTRDNIHTIAASTPIQVKDLFRMTSGLTYPGENTEVERLVAEGIAEGKTKGEVWQIQELSRVLAGVPLEFEPGTRWKYSLRHDVLGALIEVVSGKKFGQFLKEEIFEPLGMEDTFFHLPDDKKERLCSLYNVTEDGSLKKNNTLDPDVWPNPEYESGGAGLFSTLKDYSHFARMLAEGGTWNGRRIIGSKTIQLMAANQLTDGLLTDYGWNYQSGYGYGLGVRVMINRPLGGSNSSAGEFGWSGMAGTWVLIDPSENLTAVYMQQLIPNLETYQQPRLRNVIYGLL